MAQFFQYFILSECQSPPVLPLVFCMEKRERIKSVDVARFNSFAEEMKRENAEMKKDLQTVKAKVEAIDKMMKDI